jgi:uncharacterized hydantoinase/oxoprolinase family protein
MASKTLLNPYHRRTVEGIKTTTIENLHKIGLSDDQIEHFHEKLERIYYGDHIILGEVKAEFERAVRNVIRCGKKRALATEWFNNLADAMKVLGGL